MDGGDQIYDEEGAEVDNHHEKHVVEVCVLGPPDQIHHVNPVVHREHGEYDERGDADVVKAQITVVWILTQLTGVVCRAKELVVWLAEDFISSFLQR